MLYTAEARWFIPEALPDAVLDWFRAVPGLRPPLAVARSATAEAAGHVDTLFYGGKISLSTSVAERLSPVFVVESVRSIAAWNQIGCLAVTTFRVRYPV